MPMPKPGAKETQEEFISRFMGAPAMVADYPEQDQRAAVAYKTWRSENGKPVLNDDDEEYKEHMKKILAEPAKPRQNARGQSGKIVPMRFIEPGLVNYSDVGMVLVRKETLDTMLPSIIGKPIFNEMHKEVSDDDFKAGKADGIVAGNPRFNPGDGWYWIDGMVWDDETMENGRDGYSLSCAYDVTKWGPGGVHNNIPYDREVLAGEYTHLAIVNNPRYEGARLIINQGGPMKLKFWQKDKPDEAREMELVNSTTTVNGAEMPMEKVIELANAELKRQDDLKNAKATDESIIEVGGKKMTVKEAKDLAATALKNADDEKAKKDKDDEERKNAEAKEKKDKEDKEKEDMENRKNEEDHEKDKHKDKPMDNCLSCKAENSRRNAQHFEDLRNARQRGEGEFREPGLKTAAERIAVGNDRYGTKKS